MWILFVITLPLLSLPYLFRVFVFVHKKVSRLSERGKKVSDDSAFVMVCVFLMCKNFNSMEHSHAHTKPFFLSFSFYFAVSTTRNVTFGHLTYQQMKVAFRHPFLLAFCYRCVFLAQFQGNLYFFWMIKLNGLPFLDSLNVFIPL